jgi:hypothetical protein
MKGMGLLPISTCPPLHVLVERIEIGILQHRLVVGPPTELFAEPQGQLRLAHPDVPGHCEEVTLTHVLIPVRCQVDVLEALHA